jgi:hypothetical protein
MRETAVRHAMPGGDVADGVERLVVGDDLENVARSRLAEPDAGGHGDPQIRPILDARGGRAVDELRAAAGEELGRLVADDAPVPHCDDPRAPDARIEPEIGQHAADVLGATGVLDVEDDEATMWRGGRVVHAL